MSLSNFWFRIDLLVKRALPRGICTISVWVLVSNNWQEGTTQVELARPYTCDKLPPSSTSFFLFYPSPVSSFLIRELFHLSKGSSLESSVLSSLSIPFLL